MAVPYVALRSMASQNWLESCLDFHKTTTIPWRPNGMAIPHSLLPQGRKQIGVRRWKCRSESPLIIRHFWFYTPFSCIWDPKCMVWRGSENKCHISSTILLIVYYSSGLNPEIVLGIPCLSILTFGYLITCATWRTWTAMIWFKRKLKCPLCFSIFHERRAGAVHNVWWSWLCWLHCPEGSFHYDRIFESRETAIHCSLGANRLAYLRGDLMNASNRASAR